MALAESVGGEIVNADAYQLYSDLDIVTAAPTAADRERVPHHLYGVIAPDMACDAATFQRLALEVIGEIRARGRLPIVVGGSGLYIKALTHGLSPIPKSDPSTRAALEEMDDAELVSRLEELDPVGAAATNLKNRRYVIRALEITMLGGRPMSEQKVAWNQPAPDLCGVFLTWERAELYSRVNARTLEMFEQGIVEEVRQLPPELSATAEKAIGLREVRAMIAGEIDRETCILTIQQNTRRYAKRQSSWFRRESCFTSVCIGPSDTPESVTARILNLFPELCPHA